MIDNEYPKERRRKMMKKWFPVFFKTSFFSIDNVTTTTKKLFLFCKTSQERDGDGEKMVDIIIIDKLIDF